MSKTVQTILGILCVAILAAAVVFGLYTAGIINFGNSDDKQEYEISYELTGVTADVDNATTITEGGSTALTFTKTYSNYTLKTLSVDGATLIYSREANNQIVAVISSPTSSVTVTVEVTAPWLDDDDDQSGSTESGSTESGSTESGSTESGSTESGSTESGSTESGGTESGSTESGSTESGGTESGGTESGGTESGGTETKYTITWGGLYTEYADSSIAYSFDYSVPESAAAGDTVAITLSNTVGTDVILYLYFKTDSGTGWTTTRALNDGALSFTMPEDNVTITYFVKSSSSGSGSTQSGTESGSSESGSTETKYTITWGSGTLPSGYSFDYDVAKEAAAGETFTLKIYNTVGSDANIYIYIKSDDGTTTYTYAFSDQSFTFTMPESNITITYSVIKLSSGGAM